MAKPLSIKFSIHEKDLGLSHIKKELLKLEKKPFVKIGIQGDKATQMKKGSDVSLILVATVHEYGAPSKGIPERSYIRKTVNENETKYFKAVEQLKDKILDASEGMTTEQALNILGAMVQSDIQKTIQTDNAGLNGPTPLSYAGIMSREGMREKTKKTISLLDSLRDKAQQGYLSKADLKKRAKANEFLATAGNPTPLYDTGQLVRSILYVREMNGGSK